VSEVTVFSISKLKKENFLEGLKEIFSVKAFATQLFVYKLSTIIKAKPFLTISCSICPYHFSNYL